jgi:hypothetical protein
LYFIRISFCQKLNGFQETAQSCGLGNNIFETKRKRLELRALFQPPTRPARLFANALKEIKLSDEDSKALEMCSALYGESQSDS